MGPDARRRRHGGGSAIQLASVGLLAGKRSRAVLAWDTDPNYFNYAAQPRTSTCSLGPSGTPLAASASYDSTYEVVDFTAPTSGTYTLRMTRVRCGSDRGSMAWAFHVVN